MKQRQILEHHQRHRDIQKKKNGSNYQVFVDRYLLRIQLPNQQNEHMFTHLNARMVVSPSAVSEKWQSRGSWVLSSSSWRSLEQRGVQK